MLAGMANTKRKSLPEPRFAVGDKVTVWCGWVPVERGEVTKANKRGIELSTGEWFDARGESKRRRARSLKLTDRRVEASARLSEITNAACMGHEWHWRKFTLEQLEMALDALGLSFN
jgi:hypothetical protein